MLNRIRPSCFEAIDCLRKRVAYRNPFWWSAFSWWYLLRCVAISWDFSWPDVLHESALLSLANGEVSHWCFIWEHSAAIWTLFSVVKILLFRSNLSLTLNSLVLLDFDILRTHGISDQFRLLLPAWNVIFLDLSFLDQSCHLLDLWSCRYNSRLPYGYSACELCLPFDDWFRLIVVIVSICCFKNHRFLWNESSLSYGTDYSTPLILASLY